MKVRDIIPSIQYINLIKPMLSNEFFDQHFYWYFIINIAMAFWAVTPCSNLSTEYGYGIMDLPPPTTSNVQGNSTPRLYIVIYTWGVLLFNLDSKHQNV